MNLRDWIEKADRLGEERRGLFTVIGAGLALFAAALALSRRNP